MAYGEISSSLYYALGITAVYALSLTPVVFAAAGFLFALAAAAYAEGGATIPEPGGASAFARRAFNDLVGFIAGWATVLDFVLAISLSALFLPYYFAGALGQYGLVPRAARPRDGRARSRSSSSSRSSACCGAPTPTRSASSSPRSTSSSRSGSRSSGSCSCSRSTLSRTASTSARCRPGTPSRSPSRSR